jgi:nucleoside-diphosphate-sugar epimerase
MEARLREVAAEGVRTLVVRAGDFFGPAAPNSALNWLTVRSRGAVRSIYKPGPSGHAFAYLPDLAETCARLIDRETDLADFEVFHFKGTWMADGDGLANAIRRAVGRPKLAVRPFPYIVVWAIAPFNETFRELLEMRYLWERPIGLSNDKLVAFLGEEPATPIDTALRAAIADLETPAEPAAPGLALAAA